MENLKIRIIATGGTFDKVYNQATGELTFQTTHLDYILNKVKISVPPKIDCPFLVDSLEMSEQQREEICHLVKNSPEDKIIITHGTDTMVETAKSILALNLEKCVVLTGSMVPFDLHASDATFNLAYAYGSCQYLQNGVHIAMHGRVFDPEFCEKDRVKALFRVK